VLCSAVFISTELTRCATRRAVATPWKEWQSDVLPAVVAHSRVRTIHTLQHTFVTKIARRTFITSVR